jgi:hypothetical protein
MNRERTERSKAMRTWILCADNLCAKIFLKSTSIDELKLYRTIFCPQKLLRDLKTEKFKSFIRYVSDEIEIACGAGTETQLVLCAEKKILKEFHRQFSSQVRSAVVATIEQNLCEASPGSMTNRLIEECAV